MFRASVSLKKPSTPYRPAIARALPVIISGALAVSSYLEAPAGTCGDEPPGSKANAAPQKNAGSRAVSPERKLVNELQAANDTLADYLDPRDSIASLRPRFAPTGWSSIWSISSRRGSG